eukprot:GAHX01001163.1.p1 GENE.GAHX01001163.1~~GAHX01001163.1.p1  ORF type:complete len:404 (-),score=85.90 GAHX01001163.1:60-1271(-)
MVNTGLNFFRHQVSKQKRRFMEKGYDLDLSYINDRIIAMGFPSTDMEKYYRNSYKDVKKFLDEFHDKKYKIYNLCCERKYDHSLFEGRVTEIDIKDHNAANFHFLWKFVLDAAEWLDEDPENIIAVHCKAGKGRTGLVISCFLIYYFKLNITTAISTFDSARTYNNAGVTIPSQLRYISYFDRMVKGENPYQITKNITNGNLFGALLFIETIEVYNTNLDNINSLYFILEHFSFNNKVKIEKKEKEVKKESESSYESSQSNNILEVSDTGALKMEDNEINHYPKDFIPLTSQLPEIYHFYTTKKKRLMYKKELLGNELIHVFKCGTEIRIAPCYDIKLTVKYNKKEFVTCWFHTGFIKFNELRLNKFELDSTGKFYKDIHHTKINKDFRVILKFRTFVETEQP